LNPGAEEGKGLGYNGWSLLGPLVRMELNR
jgi:hypothetical protein